MSDINFSEDELDKYVIGFTENQYLPVESTSPPPSHTSFAQDYAERSNRGTLKHFLDQSLDLDRQKRLSVNKIHTNILDLMFELSSRRKVATPLLSKSAMELHRSDSRFSDLSDSSIKTSSSLPVIEVQQLPPFIHPNHSYPRLSREDFLFPDITKSDNGSKRRTEMKSRKGKRNTSKSAINESKSQPKRIEVVANPTEQSGEQKKILPEKTDENKENESKNVRFSVEEVNGTNDADNAKEISKPNGNDAKENWKRFFDKINEANKIARERGERFNEYKGRYYSISPMRKTSFCQSSYRERAEKERVDNIRRRHASQTKVGPLDFNKLRRQLVLGRSRTVFV